MHTNTHTVTPVTGTHEINKIAVVPLLAELKGKLLEVSSQRAAVHFPLTHFQGHSFQVEARSCWPGSNVSLRIRQQPVRGAGRWSGGTTDQYAAQADKQTLLGLDGPAIEGRVRVRQYCCSQLTVSLCFQSTT